MLVSRESFATILLANSSFIARALVNSWSCRPSSACLKACWETNEASDGELGQEPSSHSSGCSKLALVFWKHEKYSRPIIMRLVDKMTMAKWRFSFYTRCPRRFYCQNETRSHLRAFTIGKSSFDRTQIWSFCEPRSQGRSTGWGWIESLGTRLKFLFASRGDDRDFGNLNHVSKEKTLLFLSLERSKGKIWTKGMGIADFTTP